MHPLLSLAALAMAAAPAAVRDRDYYECKLVQPTPAGELEVSARLDARGKPEYRSVDWRHNSPSRLLLLGFWYPGAAGPESGAGSMSMSYLVGRDRRRYPLRFRLARVLPEGAIQPLAASEPVKPRPNGIASYDIEWSRFRELVRGPGTIEISVVDPDGTVLDSDRLPGDGFDLIDAQLARALTELDAMVTDYLTKCDFSGDEIVVT